MEFYINLFLISKNIDFLENHFLTSEFRILAIGNDFLISRIEFLITEKYYFYIIFITVLYHIQNHISK